MPAVEWNPAWTTGVDAIDQQHGELVTHLNTLLRAAEQGETAAQVEKTLVHLAQYVDFHFATEERLMAQTAYLERTAHQALHDDLRARMTDILGRDMSGASGVASEVLDFLRDWVTHHLGSVDQELAAHLRATLPA